ncbi:uncharacterized protein [Argopecten irradians]|uniref:uncharacterized protein n=1 Tax=Argopecten irradians TaxID=31199 RepID=UPI00371EDF75
MDRLWISVVIQLTLLGAGYAAEKTDPNCVIDPSLDINAVGNYLDCQTDERVADGTTSCCTVDNVKRCCKGKDSWDQMIIILCAIGGIALVLSILTFSVLWCLKDKVPCIGECMNFTQKKYYEVEESFCCCEGRVMKRRQQEKKLMKKSKKQPAHSQPEEVLGDTKKEDLWEGKLINT